MKNNISFFLFYVVIVFAQAPFQSYGMGSSHLQDTLFSSHKAAFLKAVEEGNLSRVQSLLRTEVRLDFRDDLLLDGTQTAAIHGRIEILRYFVSQGVDLTIQNQAGHTPLHSAVVANQIYSVEYLSIASPTALNIPNWIGYSPLHTAVSLNQLKTVHCLVSHGANTEAQSNLGSTPILLAIRKGHSEIESYLAKAK